MDPNDDSHLPCIVHLDGTCDPGDILTTQGLEPFVAGRHRAAITRHISRVVPEPCLVPEGAGRVRTAQDRWVTITLAEGDDWTLKALQLRDGSVTLTATAVDESGAEALLAELVARCEDRTPDGESTAAVGFWHNTDRAPSRSERRVGIHPWPAIRRNYNASCSAALDDLMALTPEKLAGRLLLVYGPPGTGKTNVVRALSHEWRDWCSTEYILDPEELLRNSAYLMTVILGDDAETEPDRWRLIVLEDCDEVVRSEAKAGAGQSLSRLLNLTDGLLGQGQNLLVCVTTNEDVSRFHPAVVRPGRCQARIEIGPFDCGEAALWLGVAASEWDARATLAELYAVRYGQPADFPAVPSTGQYL